MNPESGETKNEALLDLNFVPTWARKPPSTSPFGEFHREEGGGDRSSRRHEDRWVMFTRCRAWVVYQGFSYEIGLDCLDAFQVDEGSVARWRYRIPTGQGEDISLSIAVRMIPGENAVRISFYRHPRLGSEGGLSDDRPVRIILRPDIEDRNFHETTKAFTGPEHRWPGTDRKSVV